MTSELEPATHGGARPSARILDGREMSAIVRAELQGLAAARAQQLGHPPGLAIVQIGADPASAVYARRLMRAAEGVGVAARVASLPEMCDDEQLRARIATLNADPAVQGILIQQPLPPQLSQRAVAEAIAAEKDVDGISLRSAGNLFLHLPTFVPSTCAAVMEMLDRGGIPLAGRHAVVVGASNVVGKPLAFMLLHRDATVTVCHRATRDLASWTRAADVLVVAAGKPGLITGEMVKPGAAVVDVGINVLPDGEVVGDVDQESVRAVAGALTPVPGGVGPLTNLMLLKQCVLGAHQVASGVAMLSL
jgi:methylenetetrahydrofolate dehydrogenase (NADP+)/methenyltetrahydrofolate cyclohydrolase